MTAEPRTPEWTNASGAPSPAPLPATLPLCKVCGRPIEPDEFMDEFEAAFVHARHFDGLDL